MSGDRFAAALRPFVRRHLAVRITQALITAAVATAPAALLLVRLGISARACVITAIAALACAVAVSVYKRPPLAAIAGAIDARHGLQNRVATAAECTGARDTFALLVQNDAASHLASISPAVTFPFTLPRHFARSVVAAAAIGMAGIAARPATAPAAPAASQGTAAAAAAAGRAATGDPTPGEATAPGTAPAAERRPSNEHSSGGSGEQRAGDTSTPAANEAAAAVSMRTGASSSTAGSEGHAATGSAFEGTGKTASGGALAAGGTKRLDAAGGLRAGAPVDQPTNAPPREAPGTTTARRLIASGETPAGAGSLPPALRAYIRRYFDAIK